MISHHLIHFTAPASVSATVKTVGQLNRSALSGLGLKGLPLKPDFANPAKGVVASLDDVVESKRKLETLGDMPAVDMTMAEDEAGVGDLEVDDDDEEANRMDQAIKAKAKDTLHIDEDDEVDPLDAFMSDVKEEVKKVNLEDMKKIVGASGRSRIRLDERMNENRMEEDAEDVVPDELDTTDLNPEDILALAAKKAKKKELAAVDHARIRYESFRKEFYIPPPDIAAMTDEEADLLRLGLDSIKIRGIDCPRPVTKWSHFGLPANWCVQNIYKPLHILNEAFSVWTLLSASTTRRLLLSKRKLFLPSCLDVMSSVSPKLVLARQSPSSYLCFATSRTNVHWNKWKVRWLL